MKIDKSTRVAVAVQDCTIQQKEFVWDRFSNCHPNGNPVDDVTTISNKGFMREGRNYDDMWYKSDGCPVISYEEFMQSINPYYGKKVQVVCDNLIDFNKAQEAAFELGYRWNDGDTGTHIQSSWVSYYLGLGFNVAGYLTHSTPDMSHKYDKVITCDEFLGIEKPTYNPSFSKTESVCGSKLNYVKTDCYVKNRIVKTKFGQYIRTDGLANSTGHWVTLEEALPNLHQYNIMSKADFNARYNRLEIGGWPVKVDYPEPGFIKVGCQVIKAESLKGFYEVLDIVFTQKEAGEKVPSAELVHKFIKKHYKELGL